MANVFNGLQPQKVWDYFYEILQIPNPSKQEEKIAAYLVEFGKSRNLETIQDAVGNVIIRKPATAGMEGKPWVCLQGHMDMVCEKNSDTVFNFETDPIQPRIVDGWVKATGTTLGADNGIAVAAMLAILDSNDIPHGPIECLITVDEETGLTGAFGLEPGVLKSKILLNLDNEDEGQFCIGCAGGMDTVAKIDFEHEETPENSKGLKISITGLNGGHSGEGIDKKLGNSLKILSRILWQAMNTEELDVRIETFTGGNLRNAIPREAFATLSIPQENVGKFKELAKKMEADIKKELYVTEPNLCVTVEDIATPAKVIDEMAQFTLVNSLYACPHGVFAMSQDIPGLVETSTNLASVKMVDYQFVVGTSQRSNIESAKLNMSTMVATVFDLCAADVEHGEGYPGWTPNPASKIKTIMEDRYRALFNKEAHVLAIHAGLECGVIGEKYPGMDMISFGPTIRNPHSPDEMMEIASVEPFWKLLVDVLQHV